MNADPDLPLTASSEESAQDSVSNQDDRRAFSLVIIMGLVVIVGGVSAVAYWPRLAEVTNSFLPHKIRRGNRTV